jgi:serine protease inhibitor
MKKRLYLICGVILCLTSLTACNQQEEKKEETTVQTEVGPDADAFGQLGNIIDDGPIGDSGFTYEGMPDWWSQEEAFKTWNDMNRQIEELEETRPVRESAEYYEKIPISVEIEWEDVQKQYDISEYGVEKYLSDYKTHAFELLKYAYTGDDNIVVSNYAILNSITTLLYGSADSEENKTRLGITKWLEHGDNDIPHYIIDLTKALNVKFLSQKSFTFNNLIGSVCNFRQLQSDMSELNTLNTAIDYEKQNPYEFVNNYFNDITAHIMFHEDQYVTNTYAASVGVFQEKWLNPATSYVMGKNFKMTDGKEMAMKMSFFRESLQYLETELAVGCIKPFEYENYSFVAILPKPGIPFDTYVQTFDMEEFDELMSSAREETVDLYLPNFIATTELNLDEHLQSNGLTEIYEDNAKFYKFTVDPMKIDTVIHKSYFSLNGRGAKSYDNIYNEMTPPKSSVNIMDVKCDQPFVYMIIDNQLQIPIMVGTVVNMKTPYDVEDLPEVEPEVVDN